MNFPFSEGKSPKLDAAGQERLAALAKRFWEEAAHYRFYRQPWAKPRTHSSGAEVFNVFIVGAGQCGAGLYWGLQQFGIDRVGIIDAREKGREGVWANYDRMHSLRTPKDLAGPDWGFPSLTFEAYCIARFGKDYWEGLPRVMRQDYADYMEWYRTTLKIPIQNETRLIYLEPEGDLFRLECECRGDKKIYYARNVVLATGYSTDGEPFVPEYLRSLDPALYVHSYHKIDFARLAGKRVGILGHGAGAFDCAGMALEAGSKSVDLCFRRDKIPTVNPYRWFEFPGFIGHFHDLDDATRWKYAHLLGERDQPPARGGYERATAFPNFTMRPKTNWLSVAETSDGIRVETTNGPLIFDFLIAATGLTGNVKFRAELAPLHEHIATWADRYQPPPGYESASLGGYAYLGPNFEFLEKHPGEAPYLKHIFAFSSGASVSHGFSVTSLSGLRYSLMRVMTGLRSRLFTQDAEAYFADCVAYDKPELEL